MHQVFEIQKNKASDSSSDVEKTHEDNRKLAESLGLNKQAAIHRAKAAVAKISVPPLTADEVTIWRAWLPTSYGDWGYNTRDRLENYKFDRIPAPILKHWHRCKEQGLFERYEIWTPERPVNDPVLVGVNGDTYHLLGRWGESDANLLTFDNIKRLLKYAWLKTQAFGIVMQLLIFSLGLGAIGAAFGSAVRGDWSTFGGVIGGCIGFAMVAVWEFSQWNSDAVQLAIRRHDASKRPLSRSV